MCSRSAESGADAQPALRRALSRYNTGDARRGFTNGYVAKVERAAAQVVPAIQAQPAGLVEPKPAAAEPPRPAWDVFGQTSPASFVIRATASGDGP